MGKKRVYEFAKEINRSSKDVVDKANTLGINVVNHMGALSSDDESKLKQAFTGNAQQPKPANTQAKPSANQHEKPKFKSSKNNPNFQNRKGNQDSVRNSNNNQQNRPNRDNRQGQNNQSQGGQRPAGNQGQRPNNQ
ncbi:translation initiation factor IF-2 N-terminal domain-containing protein, partial [Enterococcus pallens]